jgi:glycosidase
MHGLRPEALLVGEAWVGNPVAARYVAQGGLDMTFDFDLQAALVEGVHVGDLSDVERVLRAWPEQFPAGAGHGTFLSNHDLSRPASRLGGAPGSLRLAAALLLALPGTPFLYYGEEIGLWSGPSADDRDKRTPMAWTPAAGGGWGTPWHPLSAGPAGTSIEDQLHDPGSLLSLYRTLIRIRRSSPELGLGSACPIPAVSPTSSAVWALERTLGPGTVLCVFHPGDGPARDLRVQPSVAAASAVDLMTGETFPVRDGTIHLGDLPPASFRWLRLR